MTLDECRVLKEQVDAAYSVFKKHPSPDNATQYSSVKLQYQKMCEKFVTDQLNEQAAEEDRKNTILENIEDYRVCKTCGSELLYQTSEKDYVASSDFIEDFPGWCMDCLTKHCLTTDCEACTVAKNPEACSFKNIKKIYQDAEE